MPLSSGTRVGGYDIVSKLGAGGMGEVYRARDSKLGREVALKILPEAFASDPDRLMRFEREARTLAVLNHPNIAQVYGLEDAPSTASGIIGTRALVMELVAGEDLSARIARGPIPLDEALPIARQIAEALEAAHEAGIIHRDLKPANIKVRDDGTVKVLDFGLAKAVEGHPATATAGDAATITSPAMTMRGVILGTAAYMAPEQAKGKPVDRRADIWAFGCVLYEMLTGRRAFKGDDITDTLTAVLRDEPDWTALPADLPSGVRHVLSRCLTKEPGRRVRDISAVHLALDGAFDQPPQQVTDTPARSDAQRRKRALAVTAVVAFTVGALGAFVWLRDSGTTAPRRVDRFTLALPDDESPLTEGITLGSIAISPDGSRIVYRTLRGATPQSQQFAWYLRDRGRFTATVIEGMADGGGAFFSPDGAWIGYYSNTDGALKRIPVAGGTPVVICKTDSQLRGASWSSDGTIVFATARSKGLRRVSAAGGEPEVLTTVTGNPADTDHVWPEVLPDGKAVLFTVRTGNMGQATFRVDALSLPDGRMHTVLEGGTQARLAPGGRLLFTQADELRVAPFSRDTLATTGPSAPVVDGVAYHETGSAHYAIADDGTLAFLTDAGEARRRRNVVWIDRSGVEEAVNLPPRAYTHARISPDGTRLALAAVEQDRGDISIWDLRRETMLRLTTTVSGRGPHWSPDGTHVAYTGWESPGATQHVYWQAADGSGAPEVLTTGTGEVLNAFSADGRYLAFITGSAVQADIGLLTLGAERRQTILLGSPFVEVAARISPDGRWIAYVSNESGRSEVYVRPFPDVGTAKQVVSTGGGDFPVWSRSGRELFYYVDPGTIVAVSVSPGTPLVLGRPIAVASGAARPPGGGGPSYDVSPDDKRLLVLKDVGSARSELRLVLNWAEALP